MLIRSVKLQSTNAAPPRKRCAEGEGSGVEGSSNPALDNLSAQLLAGGPDTEWGNELGAHTSGLLVGLLILSFPAIVL